MKNFILIVFSFITLSASSQFYDQYNYLNYYSFNIYDPEMRYNSRPTPPPISVDQIEYVITDKKGKTKTLLNKYDKNKRLTSRTKTDAKENTYSIAEFAYNDEGKLTFSKFYKKNGKLKSHLTVSYNSLGKLEERKTKTDSPKHYQYCLATAKVSLSKSRFPKYLLLSL